MDGRSEFIVARGEPRVRLHALHWGRPGRRALVLLHGGGANAHWWDHLAPALSDRFHVVALDFRGHGDSEFPQEVRSGAFNDDLSALLEHLDPKGVFLVGHSMGGGVALRHAAEHGGIDGLALIDVARGGGSRSRRIARLALSLRRSYTSEKDAIARYRFMPPAEHADEALRLALARHSVRRDPDGRWGYKFDPRWFGTPPLPPPDLSRIACPTLLVRGQESALLSAEGAAAFSEEIAGMRVAEIEGAGHQVQLDQPEAVLGVLRSFLAEIIAAD